MFVVLFAPSMDYHVFVLTRVRELYDRGMKTEDAVSSAIKSTAGVVTSPAVVMVCVFAVFGTPARLHGGRRSFPGRDRSYALRVR